MSGEAGAELVTDGWALFLGSGVNVSLATAPGDDGGAHARYFAQASARFSAWLARARDGVDAAVRAAALPLARLADGADEIDGVIIDALDRDEESAAAHFRRYARPGRPLVVRIDCGGPRRLGGIESARLRLHVTTRVERAALEALADAVAMAIRATR